MSDEAVIPMPRRRDWLAIFRPPPSLPRAVTDDADVDRLYASWQRRILFASTFGYAIFYFVRKNLSAALPEMERQAGISKANLGLFLTLHGVIYGLSKFANGFLGDRANARTFMSVGLLLSAIVNLAFGFTSLAVVMGVLWMLNGYFQGMGFPPNARLLTHWFEPRKLATKMSIWNTSHSLGAAGVLILCGQLAERNWRLCFFVPAAIALATTVYLLWALRDRPEAVGLPPVEREQGDLVPIEKETAGENFTQFVRRQVFGNPVIWLISLSNFFVYTIRYAVLDWGTTLLKESKGLSVANGSWMIASFEIAGAVGALIGGWMTERFFGGRGARACVFYMLACALSLWAFWKVPNQSRPTTLGLLCASGFFIYGPQCLVGIIVANLATKRAAATAVGLTGIFGYASTTLSGWGLGLLVQKRGWDSAFAYLIGVAIVGAVLFAIAWNAKPHGYDRADETDAQDKAHG